MNFKISENMGSLTAHDSPRILDSHKYGGLPAYHIFGIDRILVAFAALRKK